MAKFTDRLKHAWNAFVFQDTNRDMFKSPEIGPSTSFRPDRQRLRFFNEKSIIASIYTRLSIDIAAVEIKHVKVDENGRYLADAQSALNDCLTVEANLDQGARAFRQDMAMTLFDYGVIAVVPVDTTLNPMVTGGYDVNSLRVGRVMQWFPRHVLVRVYNDRKGIQEDVFLPKDMVAIVENPLYAVMNEPLSTLQRLNRKLNLLDAVDEQSASGNLDIIIQLPYVIKTEQRRLEAQKRLKEIEFQLKGSQYGIAYTDGTEKVVQLNRPAENNLMNQIEYLTKLLFSQLGLTDEIMNGTADEATMVNYYNRTIEPVLAAIAEAFKRTFLTKTARSQGQSIKFFRDPFSLVPVKDLAEIVDKFTRNEVASSNDMRQVIGWAPSKDPKADMLLNKNIPAAYAELPKNGLALKRPQLPPRSAFPQVPTTPQTQREPNGVGASQNGT